jgi:hypothetical protein
MSQVRIWNYYDHRRAVHYNINVTKKGKALLLWMSSKKQPTKYVTHFYGLCQEQIRTVCRIRFYTANREEERIQQTYKTIVETHFILRLRMDGPIPPFSYMPSLRVHYFYEESLYLGANSRSGSWDGSSPVVYPNAHYAVYKTSRYWSLSWAVRIRSMVSYTPYLKSNFVQFFHVYTSPKETLLNTAS